MKIAVWETPHEIAHRVAQSLAKGFNCDLIYRTPSDDCPSIMDADVHIGYGILRGMDGVFKAAEAAGKLWFNVDRGYFGPSHYDGTYRLSCMGTQARYDPAFPAPECDIEMEPWRGIDRSKPILFCPPTKAVDKFFGLNGSWWNFAGTYSEVMALGKGWEMREKGDAKPLKLDDYSCVITFNSSVGWEAVRRGIPCLSDPQHSVVGSYYSHPTVSGDKYGAPTNSLDKLLEVFKSTPREPLFRFMKANQFTLAEIEQGNACSLIESYGSAMIAGKRSQQKSVDTPLPAALAQRFQSNS